MPKRKIALMSLALFTSILISSYGLCLMTSSKSNCLRPFFQILCHWELRASIYDVWRYTNMYSITRKSYWFQSHMCASSVDYNVLYQFKLVGSVAQIVIFLILFLAAIQAEILNLKCIYIFFLFNIQFCFYH